MNIIGTFAATALLGLCAIVPARADSYLPQIGGRGGAQYRERCPQGQVLNGFELRAGDDIDAIRAVCVTASGPTVVSAPPLSNGFGAGWHGGGGGGLQRLLCPPGTPVVNGIKIESEGYQSGTISVNEIDIYCDAIGLRGPHDYSSNGVHAPRQPLDNGGSFYVGNQLQTSTEEQDCPSGEIGIGLHGHSGALVDAMGLVCGQAPTFAPPQRYAERMGHTQTGTSLERASKGASVGPGAAHDVHAPVANPRSKPKAADLKVSTEAATGASRKAIIIVGGKPPEKKRQPTVLERIDGQQDHHPD